ncbi:MAG: hypothetical protein Q7R57_09980 [Dehalococcoidales bacterium]|nr:hypothetical protein [Dehalococcoidales bacterium]
MTDALTLVGLIIALMAIWLLMPGWLIRRQMPRVIKIFRKKDAVGAQNAKTVDELGLRPKTFLQGMFSRRDYKPKALEILVQTNVVLMTEAGKLYITEENLANAKWLKLKN